MNGVKHAETHPGLDVDGCFGCRVAGVGFAASAMPGRHPKVTAINARESRWDRDMAAYRRLRRDGLQPPSIDGCHSRERDAQTVRDVETKVYK